ncbi:MAG: hypothetical protein HC836_12550 [Richelia sp. RM2_1_2]|nr:hypothetical protein [Richelia sp. RM2_1_2]
MLAKIIQELKEKQKYFDSIIEKQDYNHGVSDGLKISIKKLEKFNKELKIIKKTFNFVK